MWDKTSKSTLKGAMKITTSSAYRDMWTVGPRPWRR
jgi:hypothetical protein